MINNKTIAVVIPAFNEENQIGQVIETMPDFVDRIIIVNDCSNDNTEQVVMQYIQKELWNSKRIFIPNASYNIARTRYNYADYLIQEKTKEEIKFYTPSVIVNTDGDNEKIILINQLENGGVGSAIARGYKWAKDHNIDCTAVMAGDGQMDPDELESICNPVIKEGIDYVKGNRLIHRSSWSVIPPIRFFGNSILSILTKLASGYWHVSDTQTGFTAISNKAINSIALYKIYKSYGMPNDILVKLNITYCTLREVEIKPVYNVGEKSKMNVFKVIPRISWLLFKLFFKRLWIKYLFRDFHPLFLLYNFGFILLLGTFPYGFKIINLAINGISINPLTIMAFMFLFISGFQALLFAMWMDVQDNERLYK